MGLVVQANTLSVWLGPVGGGPIDRENPLHAAPHLIPLSIQRGLGFGGGDRLDHATFDYNLAMTGESIVNITTPFAGYARQVEIHWEQGEGVYTPVFWGDLTRQDLGVGRDAHVSLTAAVYPYHFGVRVSGQVVYDVLAADYQLLSEPIEFNPEIDGIIQGNMSSRTTAHGSRYWGDPESFRTAKAQTYQGATLSKWTIEEAVKALCWGCNASEEFIKNPTTFPASMATAEPLYNVVFDPDEYLPFYLDQLLHPLGYDWGIELAVESGATVRRIKIIDVGSGPLKTLKQQAPGETLNLESVGSYTDTEEWRVSWDIGGAINEVMVRGGHKQFEGTFELYRGWDETGDAYSASSLAMDDPSSNYAGNGNVWRRWVANEAGDYCGTRTTVAPIPSAPPDWSALGVLVDRRRRFENPLTFDDAGERPYPVVEWSDDGGTTWKPVPPEWSYRILDTECGIWFSGNTPPEALVAAGDDALVRVSATVTGDERLKHLATDTDDNCPNGRTHRLTLRMEDAYCFRERLTTGTFASQLSGAADTRDDTTAIEDFAEATLAREVSALVDGQYSLVGVRFDYSLGDMLTSIAGRNVSLNRNAAGGLTAKYPQVTAITWRPQQQQTLLATRATEVEWWYKRNVPRNSRYGREV